MLLNGNERLCDVLTKVDIEFLQNYLKSQPQAQEYMRSNAEDCARLFPRSVKLNLVLVQSSDARFG